jgi:hypothetical protein
MISNSDKLILRELAKQINDIASHQIMAERTASWYRLNALQPGRPLIIVSPEGSWRELLPWQNLTCEGETARGIEYTLRERIFSHEHINDDTVKGRDFTVRKSIPGLDEWWLDIDWGLPIKRNWGSAGYAYQPTIKEYKDIKKLRVPVIKYDEKATLDEHVQMLDLFGDILDVKIKGVDLVMFHIMYFYAHYRGLEQTFYDFMDAPAFAHELIHFFEKGYESIVNQLEEQGLLELNNDGRFVSSGGYGHTHELPQKDYNGPVRPKDMWAAAEAQELAPVSPEQSEEFVISAERRLLSRFGRNGYGCCEPLENKLKYVLSIPNMRRISVSPFSDIKKCADQIGTSAVFSWKPDPGFVSGLNWDEDAARAYIRNGLRQAEGTVMEIILADTHTCRNQPRRFTEWVRLCREETTR